MRKFANQFLALFIGLFLLLSIGVVIYTNQLVRTATTTSIIEDVENRAKNIGSLLDEWILQHTSSVMTAVEDFPSMSFLLDEKDTIAFFDEKGTAVHPDKQDDNVLKSNDMEDVLAGERIGTSGIQMDDSGRRQYHVAVSLFNGRGDFIGIFRLTHRLDELDQLENQLTQSVFIFSFVSIVLASFIALHLTNRVSRPLKQIETVINHISEGDYSEYYKGMDYPEIMALGQTVNKLADSLDEKNRTILQSNERLSALLDRLIVGVVLLDSEQRIEMMNPAVYQILGIDENLLGRSFLEMSKSYGLVQIIQQTFQKKKNRNEEIYIYYPNERILDVNTMVVPDAKGNQVIVLLYDITEIRRLEKVRTDFVANASHELRTPVTALKGFSEVLLDGALDDPDRLRQFLEIIYKESKRLEILVNDILELSRVEQKQVPMKREWISLNETVETCFKIIKPQAAAKGLKLRLLSNNADPIRFIGDQSRLEQILNNLIYNAVNYTDKGGKISVLLEETEDEIVFHVADTGIGIPEESIERLFERFYRVDKGRSRNSGGTGLGLSIVRYLVQNMGGTISVKSTLGLGSTFTVHLPKVVEEL
ncbi:two-component system histidine kinase PnpS [Jeotgalibaca arthritidis]|nr:ATP-binding protein [Jeotgalibaca arthritidis]